MSRRSSRKTNKVSYTELVEEQPESSTGSKTGNQELTPNGRESDNNTNTGADGETTSSELPYHNANLVQTAGVQQTVEPEANSEIIPKNFTTKTRHVPRSVAREANARTRPCPAFFPDPAVRLAPGYTKTHGLFEEQILVQETGERDVISTRKARDYLGTNIGAGPILEACEDLGWFKEAKEKRPVVYEDVVIQHTDYELLQSSDVASFVNSGIDTVKCLMGPLGDQKMAEIELFKTQRLDNFWPSSRALTFNAGNPVWGLDWCPTSERFTAEHSYSQYLAISTIPPTSKESAGALSSASSKSAVQIWRFGPSKTPTDKTDLGEASCALVLCLDVPPARLLKWCPLPTNDEDKPTSGTVRKLGILGGLFGDGTVRIYKIPDPEDFKTESGPAYVRLTRPLVHLALPDARFTYMDWGNSEVVAMGCSNGHIIAYNLKSCIQGSPDPQGLSILPTHYTYVHQSRVQSVKWIRLPTEPDEDPHMIVSGGFDGHIYVTDLRHPGGMPVSMYRCRDVIQAVAFSAYGAGIISNEHENMIKYTGLHPLVLGRGHNVTESRGPIWDIATSDLHPQVAVASSDGTLTIANLLKYARKGSAMPSFIHTAYRMDFNRHTSELRMLDMLVPRDHKDYRHLSKTRGVPQGLAPTDATASQRATAERERDGFGTWEPVIGEFTCISPPFVERQFCPTSPITLNAINKQPRVGIHCAAWQPSRLAQAGVLASGTASGLVRIDILCEQVFNLRPQRGEGADDDDEEDDADEADDG
ncbi:WD40 repeats protein, partial [Rhizoctonia solani]